MLIGQLKESLTQRAGACYTERPYELHPATSRPALQFLVLRGPFRRCSYAVLLCLFAWPCLREVRLEAYEGSTDENVPWLEVKRQKEKDQTDLQDSLGGIGIVTAGSNPSFDRGHQKRSLGVSHSRFERKDSDAIRSAHRPYTWAQTKITTDSLSRRRTPSHEQERQR